MARKKSLLSKEAKDAIARAKDQRKRANKLYKDKVKEMRPYLKRLKQYDLRHGLSTGQKSYVEKAWREYQALTLRPTKIYRTKSKKKLQVAKRAVMPDTIINFDVAFIPTIDDTAKVRVVGNTLRVKSKYVEEIDIPFNMAALAIDPASEIRRIVTAYPEFRAFIVMAGNYIWNGPIARSLVEEKVYNLLMRYIPGGEGYERRGPNSHYTNWAFGLRGFKAQNQADVNAYAKAYNMKAKEQKRKRRNARRKAKYGQAR